MVDEAKCLMEKGLSVETMEYYGLEYKYLGWYLSGRLTYDEMFTALNTAIHRFAKRQMTYFRGMERRGIIIHWLRGEDGEDTNVQKIIEQFRIT
jgi:tRNA dimethylallyltransferase